MTNLQMQKDLVVLVADKKIEFTVRGLLTREKALNIRELTVSFYAHPEHDPGCLLRSHDFLRPFVNQYAHALVLLDYEGSGQEEKTREELEANIEKELSITGWGDRAAAIVIDPELEMWIWSDSSHVDDVLGWKGRNPPLKVWLEESGYLNERQIKPDRPKEAMEKALMLVRKPLSASLYSQLAERVGIERCIDASFVKLKETLQRWFPKEE